MRRRSFVKTCGAFWSACLLGAQKLQAAVIPRYRRRSAELLDRGRLVANRRTGVIHHTVLSKNYLPAEKYWDFHIEPYLKKPQTNQKFDVYEYFAHQELEKGNTDKAIEWLVQSTRTHPNAMRTHDQLAKLLRQNKRYDEVHALWETAIERVKTALANQINVHRNQAYLNCFQQRLDKERRQKKQAEKKQKKKLQKN